jgi:hypothetical protein
MELAIDRFNKMVIYLFRVQSQDGAGTIAIPVGKEIG